MVFTVQLAKFYLSSAIIADVSLFSYATYSSSDARLVTIFARETHIFHSNDIHHRIQWWPVSHPQVVKHTLMTTCLLKPVV